MKPAKIHFAQSARKHRIGKAHALWVGGDDRGLELEVIAIELDETLLVIHVMPTSFRRRKANG